MKKMICVCFLGLLSFGCTKTLQVVLIDKPMTNVCNRHDVYVLQDTKLSALEKSTYLRESELVKKTIETAKGTTPTN